jgi:catechol 2,3-dioxygenase-like lactoylglutathione lyase family enzyme
MEGGRVVRLVHAGLVSSSEDKADRFFGGVLGLEKTRRSELPAELADRLFGVDEGCQIVYYGSGDLELEVFLIGLPPTAGSRIGHLCLEVASRADLLERCAAMGVAVRQAPKGDSLIVFIEDEDGNLFEIKERR